MGANKALVVDTTAPTLSNMNASTTSSTYTISGTANGTGSAVVNITFDNSSLTINSSEIVNFSVQKSLSVGNNIYDVVVIDAAGNQYNSTVKITRTEETTTTTTTSSSSSRTSSYWFATYVVNDENFEAGYFKSLANRERLKVTVEDEIHYVGVVNFTSTTATINVSSETQQKVFNIGETQKFEVTDDDYYDIEVKLTSISDRDVNISVTLIHEQIVVEDEGNVDEGNVVQEEDQPIQDNLNLPTDSSIIEESDTTTVTSTSTSTSKEETTNKKMNSMNILIILVFVLILGYVLFLLKRKANKN